MDFAGHYHHLLQLIPVFGGYCNLPRKQAAGGGWRAAARVAGAGVGRPVGAGVWLVQAVGW